MADSVSIREIVLGLADGTALTVAPRDRGVSLVPLDPAVAPAGDVALGVRETLSQPKRSLTLDALPFVRVHLQNSRTRWVVADDANSRERMLEESTDGGMPLCIEGSTTSVADDASLELIVSRIATAVGVNTPDALGPALTQTKESPGASGGSPKELAYRRAHERATQLASQVRAIDDRMTASVVPGWLFIACGVGGLAVMMTAITFFFPELRVFVVPLMMFLFVGGLAAYGWRAFGELKVRGALQANRAQLRQEREDARGDVRHLATTLRKKGLDPDEVLVRLEGTTSTCHGPAILHRRATSTAEVGELDDLGRQVIVFVEATALAGEDFSAVICSPEAMA